MEPFWEVLAHDDRDSRSCFDHLHLRRITEVNVIIRILCYITSRIRFSYVPPDMLLFLEGITSIKVEGR